MNRILPLLLALTGLLGACKKTTEKASPINIDDIRPVPTERGTPAGDISTATIGPEGGSLLSADGKLTIRFPAGALAQTTQVGIQPVSNFSPLGLGVAYRLSPEGTVFSKPVTLVFHYDDALIATTPEEFLWIVTQNTDGTWSGARKAVVDKTAKTVSVDAPHFSDWSMGRFVDLVLVPTQLNLPVGKSTSLGITGFLRDQQNVSEDDVLVPLAPLGFELAPISQVAALLEMTESYRSLRFTDWSLNGAKGPVSNNFGKLEVSADGAKYTAPGKVPSPSTVAVSVKVEAMQAAGTTKVGLQLVSNITIVQSEYYLTVRAAGKEYTYSQYGLNGQSPEDENNYAIVNFARNGDGSNGMAAAYMVNGSQANVFGMTYDDKGVSSRPLFCNYAETDNHDAMSFTPGMDVTSTLVNGYVKRTKKNSACDAQSLCAGMNIMVTAISDDGRDVSATFSGDLYNGPTDYEKTCKTDDSYPVSGEFRLRLVN